MKKNQILLTNEEGLTLYSVVWALFDTRGNCLKREEEYMYSENRTHARCQFFAGNPGFTQLHMQNRLVILEVGPVVGLEVHDDHGDQLSA